MMSPRSCASKFHIVDFKFCGSHSDRCMQIGNAIPVHLGEALAKSVCNLLD